MFWVCLAKSSVFSFLAYKSFPHSLLLGHSWSPRLHNYLIVFYPRLQLPSAPPQGSTVLFPSSPLQCRDFWSISVGDTTGCSKSNSPGLSVKTLISEAANCFDLCGHFVPKTISYWANLPGSNSYSSSLLQYLSSYCFFCQLTLLLSTGCLYISQQTWFSVVRPGR